MKLQQLFFVDDFLGTGGSFSILNNGSFDELSGEE
jgi:hypothetical protein